MNHTPWLLLCVAWLGCTSAVPPETESSPTDPPPPSAPPIGKPACSFIPDCPADATVIEGKKACDDGDPSTIDRCVIVSDCGGVCENTPGECDPLDSERVQHERCEDGNECTDGRCVETGCIQLPFSGGVCGLGTCLDGVCVD